jgi:hypothetical protein
MRKILFVIANYKDHRQEIFDSKISPRNAAYAKRHNFDYMVSKGGDLFRGNPTWWKFTLVKDLIDRGELKDGDKITHIDADMVFARMDLPYETSRSFSYAIDNGNTHCMGNYTMTINTWSRKLIDLILSEELWQKYKSTRHWQEFREQACWYLLAGILQHSYRPFPDMANYGWHSYKTTDTHFSIEELKEHVEVRSCAWNLTLLDEELDRFSVRQNLGRYLINYSRKEDAIIRHFAGGQEWRVEPYL